MGTLTGTELWIVRHGRTEWAVAGRHTGRTDVPLDVVGRAQAAALAERLADVHPDAVYCSPLRRAFDTCTLAGFGGQRIVCDDLMEWDYGADEGRRRAEIRAERPDWVIWDDGVRLGETIAEVAGRADRFITLLAAAPAPGRVLAFAHGHLLRILAARWIGMPPQAARFLVLDPAGTSVLGHERERPVIRMWNRVPETTGSA